MATTKIATPELFELESSTSGVRLPSGTTAQRPSTNLNAGDFRYNTDDNKVEFYDGSNWFQIDDEGSSPIASENFNTVLYAGNGGTQSITGVGFQPDFIWIKERNGTEWHNLFDSVRGANKSLYSNETSSEATSSTKLTSFDTDGFSLGSDNNVNKNNSTYVAWCFKASATEDTNNQGTTASTVRANQAAGFSIVKFPVTNTSINVGHGLSEAPEMIIWKNLDTADNWYVYHDGLSLPNTQYVYLNLNNSVATNNTYNFSSVTNTTFTSYLYASSGTNNVISYCFHSVAGYSKVGAYVGNGSTSGPIVTTGFEPAWLMIKRRDSAGGWRIQDNKRVSLGFGKDVLEANDSAAEQTDYVDIVFLSNGFEIKSTAGDYNSNGGTYLYYAIASDPTSTTPSLTNSFKTNLYTGTGATQTIGGHINGAAQFDGSTSGIALTGSTTLTSRTISYWVNFNDTNSATILDNTQGKTSGVTQFGRWNILMNYTSPTHYFVWNEYNGSQYGFATITYTFTPGVWYHIAFVVDASSYNHAVYVNGVSQYLTSTRANSVGTVNISDCTLGKDRDFSSLNLDGSLDQVRIYNSVLTKSQVSELYNETDSTANNLDFPSSAGCIAAYPLDSNAFDLSNNHNGADSNVTYSEGTSTNPSLVWVKARNAVASHVWFDSIRGVSQVIASESTQPQTDLGSYGLTAFNSNGFSVSDVSGGNNGVNGASGGTFSGTPPDYVAWNWGSSSIGSINNNGTSQSIVQPNTNAGFSIVKYKGTGSSATIGHGLTNPPELIFVKTLDSIDNWMVLSTAVGATKKASLNAPNDFDVDSAPWDDTAPTATVFTVGTKDATNKNGDELVAYCWHSISGYCKIGVYTGNNTTSNTIYTTDDGTSGGANGFEPGWLLIKRVDASANWRVLDNARSTSNPRNKEIYPNLSNAEGTFSAANFNSNSFEIITTDTSYNALNGEYLYLVIK